MNQPSLSYSHLSKDDSIEELHLTNRSFNGLKRAGIRTVGDVLHAVQSDSLEKMPALGTKSILEIEGKLAKVKIYNNSEIEAQLDTVPSRDYIYLAQEDPIEKLNLSKRSFNALIRSDIRTVEDITQLVESESLRPIRGLGKKCLLEIKEKLALVKIHNSLEVEANPEPSLDRNLIGLSSEDSIATLNLTLRSFNALARADIRTVGAVVELIESCRLQTIRKFEAKCILEIATKLAQIPISGNSEIGNQQSSDISSWLVEKILRDSEVEGTKLRNEIPKRVVEWQLQLVGKQLSRGMLHVDAEIAGRSIGEWGEATDTLECNQAYQVLSTILNGSINICEEIEHLLSYLPRQNSITILLFRYGLEPKSLRQTGVELGVSRERVRQLESEIKNRTISISGLKSRPALLRMQSALLIARDLGLDITYENWTQQLRLSGLAGDWISQDFVDTDAIEAMIAISKLATECKTPWLRIPENLEYAVQLAVSGTPGIPARIPYARETVSAKVKRLIDRHSRFSGGVYGKWLSQELGTELEQVTDILQALEYTSLRDGWYVPNVHCSPFEITRDEVFHRCMCKMLQYCGKLDIDDICAGIRHGISRSGFSEPEYLASKNADRSRSMFPVPPPEVMVEILRINGYQCQDELYFWDGKIDEKLSAGETIIMNCLEDVGPVLHHSELALAFTQSELSFPTLHATLNNSPLFDKVNAGLYKLRGREVTLHDIERAKASAEPQSLQPEIEYDVSGNVVVSFTLSTIALGVGTVFCDQFPNLNGNWPCFVNGVETEELHATENEFRYLRKSFELLGCKPGDRLKFVFNMWKRSVAIELAGTNAQL